MNNFKFPLEINICLNTLTENGYKAFLVGGCVRDLLLNITPHDYDIASNATPEEIHKLFERVIDTGAKHGTVTVLIGKSAIEVTQMRIDGEYKDHRRPENITPTSEITDDLKRRDFTINAMAYNQKTGLIDPFGGQNDLAEGMIRAVGNAEERFSEDALRIMRAFRFAAQLGFWVEKSTFEAALKFSDNLSKISAERIFTELTKTLIAKAPSKLCPLVSSGALEHFSICKAESLDKLDLVSPLLALRFAAFNYICNNNIENVCIRLKCDKALTNNSRLFYKFLERAIPKNEIELKLNLQKMNAKNILLAIETKEIIDEQDCSVTKENLLKIIKNNDPYKLSQLKISGNDVKAFGFSGKEVGIILNKLLFAVLADSSLNNRDKLLSLLIQITTI